VLTCVDQQQRSYKHAATQPTQWRPRSAPTVTSILASNAYLNPLLGHDLGSARLFSTTSSQGGGAFSTTDSRNPSNDDTNQPSNPRRAIPASRQRSRKTLQAEQKPQLILDLSSSSSAPESTDLDLEDLAPAALDARLADLAHRLRAAKAVDWDALYRDAQESRSLKNHLDYDYQNMQHSQKATAERKLKEEYEARVSEIKQQRADHELHIRELEDSYAKLVIYVGRRQAKEQGGEEVSERSSRRSEVRRRKDAVLRKKDELAVRMARLKATQAGIQVTTPSAPDAVDATALNASDLRIDLPNGSFMIDATTSFDTRAATSVLRKQVRHLQSCLLAFHPRLDALPSGASAAASDKHTLQTYLKVLIGRYREKTGVLGYRTPEAEAAQAAQSVRHLGVKTLSEEARQRIADKWNEKFSANRGFVMTPEALQEVQKANEKMAESQRARKERVLRNAESASNTEWLEDAGASVENKKPRTAEGGQSKVRPQQRVEAAFEEFNENGFLEDEPATEDQVRAADEVEEVRGSSAEPDRTALGKEMNEVEVGESGEKTALIKEQAAADEMDAEEAIETTAPEPSQSKDILPPTSSETIEADKTKHSTVPSLPPFHGIAGINDSAATTDSLPSPSPPTSPQPKRPVVPVPIPIPGKPKTHAYFGRRTSIYGDVEKRLRRIEKKKAAKNPVGVDTPVSPSVTAAIDALLLEYFDKFDERLKANKIEDHLTVGLVKRVKGGGSPVHRQDGKVVSPVFWAARFAVLKQERIRKTAVWPLKYPRSKTLEQQAASEQEAEEELQPSTATENEKDFRDPTRKARIAAELALLRRATTLRQDEGEPNAAPGEARAARTSIQKPLITYESSLQPKGFVMKKQRSAVAEQKKKTSTLMKQTSNTPKLIDTRAQSVSSSTGPAMAANTQFRPRRNLTVRSMMRHAYSTSSQSLDPLNEGLRAKEHESSETNASPPPPSAPPQPYLPHLTPTGSAHMVSISSKSHTTRTAIAVGTVYFSNPTPLTLITSNSLKKGDVLSVSRVAGIMAAKKCPDIVPLCHPIPLTHVGVELVTFSAHSAPVSTSPAGQGSDKMEYGGVAIECKVACTGATGVEMEALTAVMGTALSVVDMCKAVDKFQRIGDVRVVLKEGGKSGVWREEGWVSSVH
jgi:molybdenum cofactor biosynthesis protein MoaC